VKTYISPNLVVVSFVDWKLVSIMQLHTFCQWMNFVYHLNKSQKITSANIKRNRYTLMITAQYVLNPLSKALLRIN